MIGRSVGGENALGGATTRLPSILPQSHRANRIPCATRRWCTNLSYSTRSTMLRAGGRLLATRVLSRCRGTGPQGPRAPPGDAEHTNIIKSPMMDHAPSANAVVATVPQGGEAPPGDVA
jgi:hypothetical protein